MKLYAFGDQMIRCLVFILCYRKYFETVRLESNGMRAGHEILPMTGLLSSASETLVFCK